MKQSNKNKKFRVFLRKAPRDCVHLVLTINYSGASFRGLQIQTHAPTHHTVEGVLLQAMKDVGLIDQISKGTIAGDDHHLGRSCRTDRGVHALKNVVALFATKAAFEKLGGVEGIKEKLNHALLPLVRVAQVTVVSANFIPRQCCSRRVYWYMMPLYAMVAPCDSWETLLKAHPDLSTALDHCAHGTTKEGVRFWDMNASSEAELSNPSLKLIVEKVNQCNELLQKYIVGYHRFHNFSVDVDNVRGTVNAKVIHPNDGKAARFIHRCTVAPFVYLIPSDGVPPSLREYHLSTASNPEELSGSSPSVLPYLVFQIEGTSFLFNMIRKIVGCVLAVLRGVREGMMEESLSPSMRVSTPLAPGPYLMLSHSFFKNYDSNLPEGGVFRPLAQEWEGTVAEETESFRWSVICKDIVGSDLNQLPPLDTILQARDHYWKERRPHTAEEDTHLPVREKEEKAIVVPKVSEMTLFLRLLRVHNWSARPVQHGENSKALNEVKNGTLRVNPLTPKTTEEAEKVGVVEGWLYSGSQGKTIVEYESVSMSDPAKRSRPWEEEAESDTGE